MARGTPKKKRAIAEDHEHDDFGKYSHQHAPLPFPPGFLWGSSLSSYQAEGGNEASDWHHWERRSKRRKNMGRGPDHYHRFREDFDLAKKLHQNAHRLSIEWSRIEPEPGKIDEEAVRHYHEVLSYLKEQGFAVMLTLQHFTVPQWVAKKGGWANRGSVRDFMSFVRLCVQEYAQYVDYWVTINEPMVYASQSYLQGVWPPGKKHQYLTAYRVVRHMMRAHRHAYDYIHETLDRGKKRARVSFANNVISVEAYQKHSFKSLINVRILDWIWNHVCMSMARDRFDYVAVNYYFHIRAKLDKGRWFQVFFDVSEQREKSDLGWEVYPQGFFQALLDMSIYHKPIIVTENGIATYNEDKRARFLVAYLKEMFHAIATGIDVDGYFYWSLIDNFEWDKGYKPRFGLIKVDHETLERTPKAASRVYAQICRENRIEHELLKFIGHTIKP